jgi:hypothetical protein
MMELGFGWMDGKLNSIESAKMRLLRQIGNSDFPVYGDEYQTASEDAVYLARSIPFTLNSSERGP